MTEFTEHHAQLIEVTNDAVIEIRTALKGIDGRGGLLNEVRELSKSYNALQADHNRLKGNYKTLVGILIGSGILTGGAVAGLTKLIGG